MYRKSKKVIETEQWVDDYISKNGYSPTYDELAEHFNISKTACYYRCKKFRQKMKETRTIKSGQQGYTKVCLEYLVPNEKFNEFSILLAQINQIFKK